MSRCFLFLLHLPYGLKKWKRRGVKVEEKRKESCSWRYYYQCRKFPYSFVCVSKWGKVADAGSKTTLWNTNLWHYLLKKSTARQASVFPECLQLSEESRSRLQFPRNGETMFISLQLQIHLVGDFSVASQTVEKLPLSKALPHLMLWLR